MRYRFGDCEIDDQTVELVRAGAVVALEPLVYRLLTLLIDHRDRVVGKDEILDRIWTGKVVTDATLANAVKLARQAVGDSGEQQNVIRTVRGHGYRFVAQVEPVGHMAQPLLLESLDSTDLPTLPDRPSLALLGFENLGDHPSGAVLAAGLGVDLNARLAQLPGLFVIARETARRFSLQNLTVQEIGRQLGVRYLIYGTTQRSETRIRVTINLVEVGRAQIVWSERFDRIVDDVFALQDDIVKSIIAALLPELDRAEMDRARLLPTGNLDAWECYHRAMWHNFRFTADDSERARDLLQQAIRLDRAFARAYAGLSFNHFLHAFLDTDSQPLEHARQSLAFAHDSVGLEPRDAMGHWVLGRALFLSREHDQALRSLDRALKANPNYAQGHYARGFVEAHAGRLEEALLDLDVAARLSPFDPLLFAMKSSRAISLAVRGELDAACRWAVEATEEPNAHFHIHAIAGACLKMNGREESAVTAIRRAVQIHPGYSVAVFERSFPYKHPEHRQMFSAALVDAGLAVA